MNIIILIFSPLFSHTPLIMKILALAYAHHQPLLSQFITLSECC
jgi:hypothetical protein